MIKPGFLTGSNTNKKWLIFLLLPVILWAGKTIDPLEKKLDKVTGKEKVRILNRLSYEYWRKKSLEKCIAFANRALKQARKINDRSGEGSALIHIALGRLYSNREEEAEKTMAHALAILEETGDKNVLANSLARLAEAYRLRGSPIKALGYYQKALKIRQEIGPPKNNAIVSNDLGAVYWDLNQYDQALKCYLDALKIYKEIGNKRNRANTLNNIGMIYQTLGNPEKTLQYYTEALKIRKETGRKSDIAASLNNIGLFHARQNDFPKALEYFQASVKIREELDDKEGIVRCLCNIGYTYLQSDRPQKALEVYRRALTLAEATGNERTIVSPLLRLTHYYIKSNAYDKAFPLVTRSLSIARRIKSKSLEMESYGHLARIYEGKRNYKKALHYASLYSDIKESIFSEETRKKISELETKHEMEKQEKENELLKKENQTRQLENRIQVIISIAVVLLLFALLIIIYRYFRYYKNETLRKEERQKRLELESKLKLFQARVNPHFLFNSLDSIRELGYEKDPQKLEKLVQHLSHMYRQILDSSGTFVVPLENEIATVKDYLEIGKRMMKERLDYHITVDEGLGTFQIMPLSIETLVENAVTHGVAPKRKGTVKVTIARKDKSVIIEILDDGVGFDIKEVNPGFGLYSIQERLKLFYQDKARFHIHSSPGKGTRVVMELPHA